MVEDVDGFREDSELGVEEPDAASAGRAAGFLHVSVLVPGDEAKGDVCSFDVCREVVGGFGQVLYLRRYLLSPSYCKLARYSPVELPRDWEDPQHHLKHVLIPSQEWRGIFSLPVSHTCKVKAMVALT